jgi:hypothetical protein
MSQSRSSCEAHFISEVISEYNTSCSREDQATAAYDSLWRLRALSNLAKFLHVNVLTEVELRHGKCKHLSWLQTPIGVAVRSAKAAYIKSISAGWKHHTTILQTLQGLLCEPSFSFRDLECSFLRAFNELIWHACNSAALLPFSPAWVVLRLYHAITNMSHRVIPSGQRHEVRRIPITRTQSILGNRTFGQRSRATIEQEVKRNKEATAATATAGYTAGKRFLLFQSRIGPQLEMFNLILTEKDWNRFTQLEEPPHAWWTGCS